MVRGRLAIHGHFYQPERRDPVTGLLPDDRSAAPFPNWNARITAECYRPNAERGNLDRMGFDIGPTLTGWLAEEEPATLARIVRADAGSNALAQGFHHAILPLASARDRATEIRWGLADFEHRFGRPATGFWLPETAADLPTLRALVAAGIRYVILAPWQAAGPPPETRRPHRIDVGGGHSIGVMLYDAPLSGAVSFAPEVTADADRFALDQVLPALAAPIARAGSRVDAGGPLVLVATDGELYGHHQRWRDLFLARLLDPDEDRGFDIVTTGAVFARLDVATLPAIRLAGRTSWSCHHGVLRWSAECPCAQDGRWKAPLRAALERLAGGIDAATEQVAAGLLGRGPDGSAAPLDPWAVRDRYVEVILGRTTAAAFARAELAGRAGPAARSRLLALLEAQRWRLAMFASDGWYWDDPIRPETKHVLRCAGRAARMIDALAGTGLERALVADLALLVSPSRGLDGAAIYQEALARPALGRGAPARGASPAGPTEWSPGSGKGAARTAAEPGQPAPARRSRAASRTA